MRWKLCMLLVALCALLAACTPDEVKKYLSHIPPEDLPSIREEIAEQGGEFYIALTPLPAMMASSTGDSLFEQKAAEALGLQNNAAYTITITHQTKELFSGVVQMKQGRDVALIPFTIASDGHTCTLGTFLSGNNTGWKSLLPDIVTEMAMEQGLILLCEVPPVTEKQPFYIRNGAIVLLYRPYEIATYEAGYPEFELDMKQIKEFTTGAYGIGGGK